MGHNRLNNAYQNRWKVVKRIAIVIAVIVSSRHEHNISVLDEIIEIYCISSLG
jgi:hypothetical protein